VAFASLMAPVAGFRRSFSLPAAALTSRRAAPGRGAGTPRERARDGAPALPTPARAPAARPAGIPATRSPTDDAVTACALMASQINARRVGGCFVPASSSRTTVPRDAASGARRPLPIAPALKSSRMDSGKRTAPMRPPQTPSARRRALWRRTIAPARRCSMRARHDRPSRQTILATVSGRKVDKVFPVRFFQSASERRQVRK